MIVSMVSVDQYYNDLVSRFKLLHSTNQILAKLGYSPKRINKEAQLFLAFKQLSVDINVLATNAKLIVIEKLLADYEAWVKYNSNLIPPYTLRQLLDLQEISHSEILILIQFEYYLRESNIINRDKMELLLGRCFSPDIDQDNLTLEIELLLPEPTLPIVDNEFLENLKFFDKTAKSLDNNEGLTEIEFLRDFRALKLRLREDFWHPTMLSLITSINLTLKKRFSALFEQEMEALTLLTDKLLNIEVHKIAKLRGNGWLNLHSIKKYLEKMPRLLTQNYQNNYPRLLIIKRLSILIRKSAKKYNLSLQGTEKLSQIKDWLIINQDESDAPPSALMSLNNRLKLPIEVTLMDKHLAEERLKLQIQYIKDILRSRSNLANLEWLHMKYGWFMLTAPEIEIFLSATSSQGKNTNTQDRLIERAIVLRLEMQEALNFYNSRKQFLPSARGIFSISMLSYYLSQAENTCANLENYSLRLRKQGDYSKVLILLAERSRLQDIAVELHQLLNSQINSKNK